NIALKILRNLLEAGVKPNIVTDHRMTDDDAEVVVFLGAVLHDLGMVAHRENHHMFSVPLAFQLLPGLLKGVYDERERAIITAETLHTIYAHESEIFFFSSRRRHTRSVSAFLLNRSSDLRKTRYMHKMRCLLINRRSLLLALRLLWKTP